MTTSLGMTLGQNNHDAGYRVQNIENCKIIWGHIPITDLVSITASMPKKALMDAGLADRIGATFVCGLRDDLLRLQQRTDLPISERRHRDFRQAQALALPSVVADWLLTGDRGASSNALCKGIFGIPEDTGPDHPHDPDDFGRCHRFLEKTQALEHIGRMRQVSQIWNALVDRWDEIDNLYLIELPSGKAPRTYEFMHQIIEAVRN